MHTSNHLHKVDIIKLFARSQLFHAPKRRISNFFTNLFFYKKIFTRQNWRLKIPYVKHWVECLSCETHIVALNLDKFVAEFCVQLLSSGDTTAGKRLARSTRSSDKLVFPLAQSIAHNNAELEMEIMASGNYVARV